MEIDKLVLKKIEYSIKYHADVFVTLPSVTVPEVSSSKYLDTMALCLPVCEKPNKSLAFWLHKQDIVQELYMAINTFNLKRAVSLRSLLEQQYHAW